jgi:hypothetical protein
MERRLLKSAILTGVVVLASACTPGKTGAGGAPANTPNDSPRATTSSNNTEGTPDNRAKAAGAQRERPWAHNTGPSNPEALTPSASLKIRTDGAVVENLDIRGRLTIDANNVTVRNFRIDGSDNSYGIKVESGHTNILIEDGEITNCHSAGILAYSGITVRRIHIHDTGADGLKIQGGIDPTLIESCFLERLGMNPGAHADGNQTRGGSNITFRYNNIYMPYPGTPDYPGAPFASNAAIFLETPSGGTTDNIVIDGNWLTGGNYTVYCSDFSTNVSVTNNFFGRYNAGWPGKERRRVRAGNCDTWSNNRWEDTGEPM